MRRIVLVIDKSPAFLSFQQDRKLKEWGVEKNQTKQLERVLEAGTMSLFGDAPLGLLTLANKEAVDIAVQQLTAASPADLDTIGTPGLIIVTDVDKRSLQRLQKAVEAADGEVIMATEGSKDKTPASRRLISSLGVPTDVKRFLEDYAGDDYSSILGVVKALADIPPAAQKKVTIEDVAMRLPTPPGGVPPWELERPLMAGDLTKTIELFRRISKAQHLLVPLAVIKNKFWLAWRVSALISITPSVGLPAIAEALQVPNNYPLKLAVESAKKHGTAKLERIMEALTKAEAAVKGGSSAAADVTMEIMLTSIHNTLRS